MNKDFLNYYNKELAFVRRQGAEFAKQHPKVAGHLRMSPDAIEDPHVSRLIEAVAFLNAGIRQRLDDDYPELSSALLNILYPHYLAPIPSMAIVQFQPALTLTDKSIIEKGRLIETLPIDGLPIRFQTCYETTLWPIKIVQAKLYGHSQLAPSMPGLPNIPSTLEIKLETLSNETSFADLAPSSLRFFIKGAAQQVYALYELIMQETVALSLINAAGEKNAVHLERTQLKAVGFSADDGMLPYSAHSNLAYRLLTEYFTFPEKFLFFEISDLTPEQLQHFQQKLSLFFYFKQGNKALEQYINADFFALGCTPIVNLFRKTAEPINWDHTKTQYPITLDPERSKHYEVYSIDEVTAIDSNGNTHDFLPFYGIKHEHRAKEAERFWLARRYNAHNFSDTRDQGTEMELSLIDLNLKPASAENSIISVTTTCLSRDLPNYLPFGDNEPYLQFMEGGAPVEKILCLTAPTSTRRLSLGGQIEWRLISHLSINHLSLMKNIAAAETLREILRLYDYSDSEETQLLIKSIENITTQRVVARDPSGSLNAFCQGVAVTLELDQTKFTGNSAYLFSSILDHFFALYCSINSFTKLKVVNKGQRKVIQEWPARSGEQLLL
jgi:type VI secretion system protein ImpG